MTADTGTVDSGGAKVVINWINKQTQFHSSPAGFRITGSRPLRSVAFCSTNGRNKSINGHRTEILVE
jgi:hypothetical protein